MEVFNNQTPKNFISIDDFIKDFIFKVNNFKGILLKHLNERFDSKFVQDNQLSENVPLFRFLQCIDDELPTIQNNLNQISNELIVNQNNNPIVQHVDSLSKTVHKYTFESLNQKLNLDVNLIDLNSFSQPILLQHEILINDYFISRKYLFSSFQLFYPSIEIPVKKLNFDICEIILNSLNQIQCQCQSLFQLLIEGEYNYSLFTVIPYLIEIVKQIGNSIDSNPPENVQNMSSLVENLKSRLNSFLKDISSFDFDQVSSFSELVSAFLNRFNKEKQDFEYKLEIQEAKYQDLKTYKRKKHQISNDSDEE